MNAVKVIEPTITAIMTPIQVAAHTAGLAPSVGNKNLALRHILYTLPAVSAKRQNGSAEIYSEQESGLEAKAAVNLIGCLRIVRLAVLILFL